MSLSYSSSPLSPLRMQYLYIVHEGGYRTPIMMGELMHSGRVRFGSPQQPQPGVCHTTDQACCAARLLPAGSREATGIYKGLTKVGTAVGTYLTLDFSFSWPESGRRETGCTNDGCDPQFWCFYGQRQWSADCCLYICRTVEGGGVRLS